MATMKFQHSSGFIEKASIDQIIKINEDEFFKFKKILNIFKHAEKGDKLMKNCQYVETVLEGEGQGQGQEQKEDSPQISKNIDQDKYYLIKNTALQSIWRWWYGENQENTFKYIEDEMNAFIEFLDKILVLSQKYYYYSTFQKFIDSINAFITEILPGLYSFKQTYPEYTEIISLIDSIILTLLDFKNNIKRSGKNKKTEKDKPRRKLSL